MTLFDYSAEIEVVQFRNPLEISAFFKNISMRTARWVLDRTIFYQQERDKREIANEISRQKLLEMKLTNAGKAVVTRRKLIRGGLSEEEATRLLGNLLSDQQASARITGPDDRR